MNRYDPGEQGIEALLDLDRQTIEVGDGYWVAIRAKRVPQDAGRPHGLEYALTLHGPGGKRTMLTRRPCVVVALVNARGGQRASTTSITAIGSGPMPSKIPAGCWKTSGPMSKGSCDKGVSNEQGAYSAYRHSAA